MSLNDNLKSWSQSDPHKQGGESVIKPTSPDARFRDFAGLVSDEIHKNLGIPESILNESSRQGGQSNG